MPPRLERERSDMVTAFKSYIELHWLSWVFLAIIGGFGWLVANIVAKPLLDFWADRKNAIQVLRTNSWVGSQSSEESFMNALAAIRQASAQILFYAEGGPFIVRLYSKFRGYDLRLAGHVIRGLNRHIGERFSEDGISNQCDAARVCLGATRGMTKSRRAAIRKMLAGDTEEPNSDAVPEAEKIVRRNVRWDLIAIIVAVVAAGFTGLQWWETHKQNRLSSEASIGFDIDTDPADNRLGIGVRNVGPGVARIRSVKYYVDGKQVSSIDDAIEGAKLDLDRLHPIELTDEAMGPGEIIWIVKYNARKPEIDRAAEFFENHLNAAVDYCTAGGRCGTECSQPAGGCGKSN